MIFVVFDDFSIIFTQTTGFTYGKEQKRKSGISFFILEGLICNIMYTTDFAYDGPIFLVPLSPSYQSSPVYINYS